MYKKCKTSEALKRQREFETCLLTMMKSIAYKKISVTDLCSKIGIARKNFYRYFENKDDVLVALIDHTINEYPKYKFPYPNTSNDLFKEIDQYLNFWQNNHLLLEALTNNCLETILMERVLIHAWRFDKTLLQFDGTINDPNNVTFVISGLISLVFVWHRENYKTPKCQLARIIQRLLSEPIFPLSNYST